MPPRRSQVWLRLATFPTLQATNICAILYMFLAQGTNKIQHNFTSKHRLLFAMQNKNIVHRIPWKVSCAWTFHNFLWGRSQINCEHCANSLCEHVHKIYIGSHRRTNPLVLMISVVVHTKTRLVDTVLLQNKAV